MSTEQISSRQQGVRDRLIYSDAGSDLLHREISTLLNQLGPGKVSGVAYDTAWIARLAPRYPGSGFERALEWLRRNQYADGSWGGSFIHYHDRFVSTLAAIVALRECGDGARDERRVKRGENVLWKLVGRLGRDDSDTIGFPVISASLASEATELGLDVPLPPIRFAGAYRKKVEALLHSPERAWRASTLTFSLEALRKALHDGDEVLEANGSVASSPSATAAYLLTGHNPREEQSLRYLRDVQEDDGSVPAVAPIDLFEIAWSLHYLRVADAVSPDHPAARSLLDYLWRSWASATGTGYSSFYPIQDLDDTSVCFSVLNWGDYPVQLDVFEHYENENHFDCFHGETNPALSAHVRLLASVRSCCAHPLRDRWIAKITQALHRFDDNGSFWWDKWHSSPYYVSGAALSALRDVDDELAYTRYKWITRTQNDDGGWGYLNQSTLEETAYCLQALVGWHQEVSAVDADILDTAAEYLWRGLTNDEKTPLWIGKSLYHPDRPVRAAVLGALYSYASLGS